jgi:quinol monooxygenase YgiN
MRQINPQPAMANKNPQERLSTLAPQSGRSVIFSILSFCPSLKNRAQLIELLRSVLDLSRPCPGRMGCWISDEDYLQNRIIYAEQWQTEEALHEHIRSDLYRRLLSAIELSETRPEVNFYYATGSRGFDLIESLRQNMPSTAPWE